ncbi:hypothetical protein OH77DRAFT_907695 [Trametes cingulata]|nr:hypothetical protein OH77DRAFT_907695 [Trametes cingulata]
MIRERSRGCENTRRRTLLFGTLSPASAAAADRRAASCARPRTRSLPRRTYGGAVIGHGSLAVAVPSASPSGALPLAHKRMRRAMRVTCPTKALRHCGSSTIRSLTRAFRAKRSRTRTRDDVAGRRGFRRTPTSCSLRGGQCDSRSRARRGGLP